MSGHSHYATIKRQKASNDAAKGRVFSRHAKAIGLAIKAGGGADPEMNSRLRFAIEQAKIDNMPKVNIERILARAEEAGDIQEATYEGYGPAGVAVIVAAATDNKNRTAQEIKNLFERGGGSLAGPGAVAFNFEQRGYIVVAKSGNPEEQTLALIDLGVEDVEESADAVEVYVQPDKVGEIRQAIAGLGYTVVSFEQVLKPKNLVAVNDAEKAKKVLAFLNSLEEHEDVQNVYANLDIPPEIVGQLAA